MHCAILLDRLKLCATTRPEIRQPTWHVDLLLACMVYFTPKSHVEIETLIKDYKTYLKP